MNQPVFTTTVVESPRRSRLAIYEAGPQDGQRVLVCGGFSARPITDGTFGGVMAQAAARGKRIAMLDVAACGRSKYAGLLTMATWLDDLQFVAERFAGRDFVAVGTSVGAWLMLFQHQRGGLPFRSMCALAPAIDWDDQYIQPRLRGGTFVRTPKYVMEKDAPFMPTSLLDSMPHYHLLAAPFEARAPIHIIHGDRDDLAPIATSRHFVGTNAAMTLEVVPGQDHGVAKLAGTPSQKAFERWLDSIA